MTLFFKKCSYLYICFSLLLGLSACASIDSAPESRGGEIVYHGGDAAQDARFPSPENPVSSASGFSALAREMSTGDVQIFSLDGDVRPNGGGMAMSAGVRASQDPNVTVYSLNDGLPKPSPYQDHHAFPDRSGYPVALNDRSQISLAQTERKNFTRAPSLGRDAGQAAQKIYFRHGSSALSGNDKKSISSAAKLGAGHYEVEGFASTRADVKDPVSRKIINLKMSMDRAFQVSSALMREGVPAGAIITKAYGDAHPAMQMDGKSAEAASRRVDIHAQGARYHAQDSGIPALLPYGE